MIGHGFWTEMGIKCLKRRNLRLRVTYSTHLYPLSLIFTIRSRPWLLLEDFRYAHVLVLHCEMIRCLLSVVRDSRVRWWCQRCHQQQQLHGKQLPVLHRWWDRQHRTIRLGQCEATTFDDQCKLTRYLLTRQYFDTHLMAVLQVVIIYYYYYFFLSIRCFVAVGWVTGRASGCKKSCTSNP